MSKKRGSPLSAHTEFSEEDITELIETFLAVEGPDVAAQKRQYSLIKPEAAGTSWNFRFQIAPVIPNPFDR